MDVVSPVDEVQSSLLYTHLRLCSEKQHTQTELCTKSYGVEGGGCMCGCVQHTQTELCTKRLTGMEAITCPEMLLLTLALRLTYSPSLATCKKNDPTKDRVQFGKPHD